MYFLVNIIIFIHFFNYRAAFQYGVKMADGRKTRRAGPRDDKKEHDREWAKIKTMIEKRRPEGPSNKKIKM